MRLNKIFITTILIVLLVLFGLTNVYATDEEDVSGVVTLTLDSSSSYTVGEEIIFNMNIDVTGFEGISIFYANVSYSKDMLEYKGIVLKDGWTIKSKKEDCIYIKQDDYIDEEGLICQLKFKVLKNDIDTTVKLEGVNGSGENGEIHVDYGNVDEPSFVLRAPQITDPGTTDPGTTDPGTTDPGTTDPGTTDPGTTDPGTTDPGTTDPGITDPGTTDPGTTDPGTTNPGTTDPGEADPGTTNPGEADPGTTKPTKPVDNTTAGGKIPQTGIIPIIIIVPIIGASIFLFMVYRKYAKQLK